MRRNTIQLGDGATVYSGPGTRNSAFLPIIATGERMDPQNVAAFISFLVHDSRQQRPILQPCDALQQAALWHCEDMAARSYFAHCTPDQVCANQMARAAGCVLPWSYGDGNNIETLAAGSPDAHVIFAALANSPRHADHLFGRNAFFREQTHYGVGYVAAPGSVYGFYWSIMIGICE